MSPRAVVVVGTDPHTDRWHDLAATGAALAATLDDGFDVAVTTTSQLAGLGDADLVVVDAAGEFDASVDSRAVVDALLAAHRSGAALLAVHASATAFSDDPRWADLMGGRWVLGVSWHPPHGLATVHLADRIPFGRPGTSFELHDERYTDLELLPGSRVVALHDERGARHPLVWAREGAEGCGRVVYSALGHDSRSFAAEGHRRLLRDAARWATAIRRPAIG